MFGGALARVQLENMEQAKTFTMFSHPPAPSTVPPIPASCIWFVARGKKVTLRPGEDRK